MSAASKLDKSTIRTIFVGLAIGFIMGVFVGFAFGPRSEVSSLELQVEQLETEIESLRDEITRLIDPTGIYPLWGQTIEIGVISPTTSSLEIVRSTMSLAEDDVNAYCEELGCNVTFQFLIEDAEGQVPLHTEKLKAFKERGINLVIGGAWSSQADCTRRFCLENNMLVFSPSSTSPVLCNPLDNLFRLAPCETLQSEVLAEMLSSYGIKAIIVIHSEDHWADGTYNQLKIAFENRGGVIGERIRYVTDATNFSDYLQIAEEVAVQAVERFGKEHVALEIIGSSEVATIVEQAKEYPIIFDLPWFGTEETSSMQRLIDEVPEEAGRLKIFSPVAVPAASENLNSFIDRYHDFTGQTLGSYSLDRHDSAYYAANWYDIAWLYAKAIVEAQTTNATAIRQVLPQIAENHVGISGPCRLNEYGDREISDYDVCGYGTVDGAVENIKYGHYDSSSGDVRWNEEKLGFHPTDQG